MNDKAPMTTPKHEGDRPVFAALETLRTNYFKIFLARIFGQKYTAVDSGCLVTISKWRGKCYLIDCKTDSGGE